MTFELFDKLLLLSRGKATYNGRVADVREYFASLGYEMPLYTNPAEYIIQLVNTDFSTDDKPKELLADLHASWTQSAHAVAITAEIKHYKTYTTTLATAFTHDTANPYLLPFTLMHRSFIKSYRDLVAYGIRIAMYMGRT